MSKYAARKWRELALKYEQRSKRLLDLSDSDFQLLGPGNTSQLWEQCLRRVWIVATAVERERCARLAEACVQNGSPMLHNLADEIRRGE